MPECSLTVQVEPADISFVNWVLEGYEYLGVVSTLDNKAGVLLIRSTADMLPDLKKVLCNFSFPVSILK